ncbi:MAG TPA: caspase family protein [Ktedonosporobacter sp.]|nr:caspase family protein [Ktedonosporobacter sp.]
MPNTDFAVVIGISHYSDLGKPVPGAIKDADRFIEWLKGPAGVPDNQIHIKRLVSKDPPDPGKNPVITEIDDAFEKVLAEAENRREENRRAGNVAPLRLYVYFAGHGCSQGSQHMALLLGDASRRYLNKSLDSSSYHDGLVRNAIFPEQVFFYDCCRNFDRRVVGRRSPWSDADPSPGAANVRQVIFYAAGFTEYANETVFKYNERQQGLFTMALLEALNGGGAVRQNNEWVITAYKVAQYVHQRLDELTKPKKLRQHLGWYPGGVDDLVLAPTTTPLLHGVHVSTQHPGTEIVVYDETVENEVGRRPLVGNATELRLPAGNYVVAVNPTGPKLVVRIGPGEPTTVEL